MAKTTAPKPNAPEGFKADLAKTADEKGPGKATECKGCSRWYHHRAAICPACGHPNDAKPKAKKRKAKPAAKAGRPPKASTGQKSNDGQMAALMDFVRKAGGLKKARAVLDELIDLKD